VDLSNNIPVVIWSGKIALPDKAGGVKDRLYMYFAVYQ
jgi:hypothetical protein